MNKHRGQKHEGSKEMTAHEAAQGLTGSFEHVSSRKEEKLLVTFVACDCV